MINYKLITQAIKSILQDNLDNTYIITRNEERNVNPNVPLRKGKLINILRGSVSYEAYTLGTTPWLVSIKPMIEIQISSMISGEDAEDRLQDAEQEVMNVLTANKRLNNTIAMTNGYSIEYQYNQEEQCYHHSAIITIETQAQAG